MKLKLTIIISLFTLCAHAQLQTIDIDRLSTIISNKQQELKTRVLQNLVVKTIRPDNYTTYNAIYNLVDIITSEKNKTVMTQKIISQITDYTVTTLVAKGYVDKLQPDVDLRNYISLVNNELTQIMHNFQNSQNYIRDSTRGNTGKSNFYNIMASKYKATESGGQIIQSKKSANNSPQFHGMDFGLLTSFIVDTLHQLLQTNQTLTGKGLFKPDLERKYFSTGLDLNYSLIRNNSYFKDTILPDLIKYVAGITSIQNSTEAVIKFINDPNTSITTLNATFVEKTLQPLLSLFETTISQYRNNPLLAQNSFISTIGDIITKYFVTDLSANEKADQPYTFKIDVDAIILAFEQKFSNEYIVSIQKHYFGFKPFFNIGLNYAHFINSNNTFITGTTQYQLSQLEFAGEKLGFKLIFADYEYTHSHSPMENYLYRGRQYKWLQPASKPLINNVYAFFYGSGLIYNIVNVKSNSNFNNVIIGAGGGLEFFNGLEINLSYAIPYIAKSSFSDLNAKGFINFGFDIPIFEYLSQAIDKSK